jgi:hypothetical protein
MGLVYVLFTSALCVQMEEKLKWPSKAKAKANPMNNQ